MSSPISAFTAVPNPQMLAFMGAQSFIMMFQAGEGWQYGKRRISAMSNEDFNKLTPERLLQNQSVTLKSSIRTIEQSMNAMTPMVGTIVAQYGDFIKEIIKVAPLVVQNIFGDSHAGQTLSGNIEGGFDTLAAIDKKIGEFAQSLKDAFADANAQVPSSDIMDVDVSKLIPTFKPKVPSPPKTITPSRGFLGGPAPKTSLGQKFREFEKTRNPAEKLLAAMEKSKAKLVSEYNRILKQLRQGGRGTTSTTRKIQSLRKGISQVERQIVLQKVKINKSKIRR